MEIFIRLLIAHLIGDFLLQPAEWVKDKEEKKLASVKLYLHTALHISLSYLFLWDADLWYIPGIVGLTHYIIDGAKLILQNKKNSRLLFFADQLLHVFVLAIIAILLRDDIFSIQLNLQHWVLILCTILLTYPASVIIKTLISVYTPKTEMQKDDSLQSAGMYIGILERLLVFIFIATNHWEGVGFLIAAKSIFRFSDLSQAKDRKLTEYILIGTLLSFGTAIIAGLVFRFTMMH